MKFSSLFCVALLTLLTGCVKNQTLKGRKEIIFIPKENINNRLSLKVYIVQVFSEEARKEMETMTSEKLFEKTKNIVYSFPGEVKIWEYDIVEHSQVTAFVVPGKKRYYGIFVFFNFTQKTESKLAYPAHLRSLEISIENNAFEISAINKKQIAKKNPKNKVQQIIYLNEDDCLFQGEELKLSKKRFC